MNGYRSYCILCCLVMQAVCAAGQNEAVVLVIPNTDCTILLDGLEKGPAKAGTAFRLTTTAGEHYLEGRSIDQTETKGELIQLDSGKQKIIKLEIPIQEEDTSIESVIVAEINFPLPGSIAALAWQSNNEGANYPYPEFYYAFDKGDEIILDASMSNKNGTNAINVSTYPDGVLRFTNNAFSELKDLKIKVPERSIYRFVFATNHAFDRNCFLKIRRKPESRKTETFNTNVLKKLVVTPVSIHEPQDFFINGGLNATFSGGRSRVTLPVSMPENTIEWYYRFSASREKADMENVKSNFKLFSELTSLVLTLSGPGLVMKELAIESLTQPPGADYCEIYLLPTEDGSLFETKADGQWRRYPEGSRENFKSGNVKIKCCTTGQYTLGIKNPASSYGVNVSLEIVAITAKEEYVIDIN